MLNGKGGPKRVRPPAPDRYNIATFPKDAPTSNAAGGPATSYSMPNGRPAETGRKDKAGPGAYHPKRELTEERQPSLGFGSSRRMLSEPPKNAKVTPHSDLGQNDNPYMKKGSSFGFGTSGRVFELAHKEFKSGASCNGGRLEGQTRPGPGKHDPQDAGTSKYASAPKSSMTPRREPGVTPRTTQLGAPGPGAYLSTAPGDTEHPTVKNTPRYKFGTCARMLSVESGKKQPGPGAYQTTNACRTGDKSVGDSAPKWSMPGRAEFSLANEYI